MRSFIQTFLIWNVNSVNLFRLIFVKVFVGILQRIRQGATKVNDDINARTITSVF